MQKSTFWTEWFTFVIACAKKVLICLKKIELAYTCILRAMHDYKGKDASRNMMKNQHLLK